jgi:hypothetical protein
MIFISSDEQQVTGALADADEMGSVELPPLFSSLSLLSVSARAVVVMLIFVADYIL